MLIKKEIKEMRNKLEYLNRLEQLNAKLIRLKFEIEQTKDELTAFEIEVKDLLSNKIDLKDLKIKKLSMMIEIDLLKFISVLKVQDFS